MYVKWHRRKLEESHYHHHIDNHIITFNNFLVASLQIYGYKNLILSTLNVIMHQRKICFCHSSLLETSTFVSSFFTFKIKFLFELWLHFINDHDVSDWKQFDVESNFTMIASFYPCWKGLNLNNTSSINY